MISVIIPVYRVEKVLVQCLDSVLGQSYRDIEVLCVNDASPDGSMKVLQHYAAKDSRVRIIDKAQNEGVDKARFDGLAQSRGAYVFFIDSDDWLPDSEVFSYMMQLMNEHKVDYVEVNSVRVLDRHGWITRPAVQNRTGLIKAPDLFNHYYISFFGLNLLSVNIWGKLYRKEVILRSNPEPSGFKMGEDLVFSMHLFPYLKSIYISDRIGYCYRFGGMTNHYNPNLLPELKQQFLLKEKNIRKFEYDKATRFIQIEMKNILRSEICQLIMYRTGTPEEITERIRQELKDPIWSQLDELYAENAGTHPDAFTQALKEKDADFLYRYCRKEVGKQKYRRQILFLLSRILAWI